MENQQEKCNLNWQSVESALEEGSSSGYKIAVLETAKLLSQALEEQNFSGKNFEERLNSAGKMLIKPLKSAKKLLNSRILTFLLKKQKKQSLIFIRRLLMQQKISRAY
jgi:hypothetical protein